MSIGQPSNKLLKVMLEIAMSTDFELCFITKSSACIVVFTMSNVGTGFFLSCGLVLNNICS